MIIKTFFKFFFQNLILLLKKKNKSRINYSILYILFICNIFFDIFILIIVLLITEIKEIHIPLRGIFLEHIVV